MVRQSHLEGGFDDRTNERTEARIGVLNVELITRTVQPNGQHTASVNDFNRSVDWKVSDCFRVWMLRFPIAHRCEVKVGNYVFTIVSNQFHRSSHGGVHVPLG